MAQPTATFLDEAVAAARGCLALVTGNRRAPSYFDFSRRGLIGSLIALVLSIGVQALGPQLMADGVRAGLLATIGGAVLIAVQFGAAWLFLRWLNRGDGFVPFVVAFSWAALFESLLLAIAIGVFGPPFVATDPASDMIQLSAGAVPLFILGIVALIVTVNIGRLIVTLRPLHVVLLLLAQLFAVMLGSLLF